MDSHFRTVILLQTDSETALISTVKHHYSCKVLHFLHCLQQTLSREWDNVVMTLILNLKVHLLDSDFYNICNFS